MKKQIALTLIALLCSCSLQLMAQHTIGIATGIGSASFRPYPDQETQSVTGGAVYTLSWRYYSLQRSVGAIGIDVEYMQRGFAFVQNSASVTMGADPLVYTRRINSIMVPFIWQPHAYFFNHRLRVMLEAAATLSYDLSSTYENEWAEYYNAADWEGTYEYKTARDNRLGYGLMGG
ncbi:MAG: PorT family protein, partial [Rikenellaceae bacterium]